MMFRLESRHDNKIVDVFEFPAVDLMAAMKRITTHMITERLRASNDSMFTITSHIIRPADIKNA
jgi:hypothetical protein